METGLMNSLDGDNLSVISHLYDQGMLDDSDSLLNIMQDEFSFSSFSTSHLLGTSSLWDQGDGTDEELHDPLSVDSPPTDVFKEDFQKILSDWQEHLGPLQASDSEEMDVKDLVGLDMHMPKNVPVEIPSDIFEDSPCALKTVLSVGKMPETPRDRIFGGLSLNLNENLNSFNLKNFLEDDCEEEHKFGLIVADVEEDLIDEVSDDLSGKGPKVESITPLVKTPAANVRHVEIAPTKVDVEEEAIDVETVMDQIPVLEAGDLKSLLEQFEASEAFNSTVSPTASPTKNSVSEPSAAAPQVIPSLKKRIPQSTVSSSNTTSTFSSTSTSVSTSTSSSTSPSLMSVNTSTSITSSVETNRITLHETIRDSLPQEVIDRIKASNRRKPISVIPAMPSRRPGRGATRMQVAAATLSRNKLLKLVSGGGKGGESIQLDHDYCSSAASPAAEVPPPKSFYHSNASEYASEQSQSSPSSSKDSEDSSCAKSVLGDNKVYSRLPEYYVVLAPQKAVEKGRKGSVKEEVWDKNSRKDSGLESGEVSDASEETIGTPMTAGSRDVASNSGNSIVKSEDRKCVKNIVPSSTEKGVVTVDVQNKSELPDRKKTKSVLRAEGSQCVMKDWSALRQDNGKSKPVAMVSVLKKNNVSCTTNIASRQQSLLISSNSSNCTTSSSNNSNITSSMISGETEIKSEGPKKRKLNLEEYRSRLKEMDRTRVKEELSKPKSGSVAIESPNSNAVNEGVPVQPKEAKKEGSVEVAPRISTASPEEDKEQRPKMQSVEVQTQTSIFDEAQVQQEKSKERRSRKKQRKYYSKRASSSSSSHSTSSSGSRRHRKSRSQMRRRTSRRRSHAGHSVSSSGSQRPRSRSNSSRSSSSYSSYSSRSRSRSRSRSSARRSPSCCRPRPMYPYQHRYGPRRPLPYSTGWRSRSRSPPYGPRKNDWMLSEREKQRQVEERRVIYVGRIDEGTSKAELRRRFEPFGPIIDISVHFREHGDNYGFVTFAYKVDAYEAVEHGNDDPNLPRYDLCFGGRRAFCKTRYADLDGIATSDGSSGGYMRGSGYARRADSQPEDFDLLLREAQAKLRKRKV